MAFSTHLQPCPLLLTPLFLGGTSSSRTGPWPHSLVIFAFFPFPQPQRTSWSRICNCAGSGSCVLSGKEEPQEQEMAQGAFQDLNGIFWRGLSKPSHGPIKTKHTFKESTYSVPRFPLRWLVALKGFSWHFNILSKDYLNIWCVKNIGLDLPFVIGAHIKQNLSTRFI